VVIAGLVSFNRHDIAYAAVILWALAGIGIKFPQQGMVTIGIWIAFGLVAVTLGAAMLIKRKAVQG
jgi:membrane-bound ClpP family serine protease